MTEQEKENLRKTYIAKTKEILKKQDYKLLEQKKFKISLLKKLHIAFNKIYKEIYIGCSYGSVLVPGLAYNKENISEMQVVLLDIDLKNEGKHCGTVFITSEGLFVDSFDTENAKPFLTDKDMLNYDYCYTAAIDNDIHLNFDEMPSTIIKIIDKVI